MNKYVKRKSGRYFIPLTYDTFVSYFMSSTIKIINLLENKFLKGDFSPSLYKCNIISRYALSSPAANENRSNVLFTLCPKFDTSI